MQILTLDFETYYDKDYTLKKLSTSEYVRDPRFETLSCSFKFGDEPAVCYFGHDEVKELVRAVDWDDTELLCHHTQFDGLILEHHFGAVPKVYRDTLSMARALYAKSLRNDLGSVGARLGVAVTKAEMPDFAGRHLADLSPEERQAVGRYNNTDVESTYLIYQAMLRRFPPDELALIDVTVRMFADPVLRVDRKRAMAELEREVAEKGRLVAESGAEAKVLASRPKFAKALEGLGVTPPMKLSKTTGKPTLALAQTDQEFTDLAYHADPRVKALVAGRMAVTSSIGETRARRLLRAGEGRWRVPVYLNYCGAHTTRWSGGDKMNFQNFPRGGELRRSILAPPGCVIVVVDSAQIECRGLAWLAGEQWLLDEFSRAGGDPYCVFASKAYGRTITKADDEERRVGKICVLGLGYGMGAFKLHLFLLQMGITSVSLDMCDELVRIYRETNQDIGSWWNKCGHIVHDMYTGLSGSYKCLSWEKDLVHLPNGLDLHYPDVVSSTDSWYAPEPKRPAAQSSMMRGTVTPVRRQVYFTDQSYTGARGNTKIYGALACENFTQALARIIVGEQMLAIAERYRVVMMSHDEVVYVAPKRSADKALEFGLQCMRTPPSWAPDIPLNAEGGYDVRYSK
jgi:hypothetical protein